MRISDTPIIHLRLPSHSKEPPPPLNESQSQAGRTSQLRHCSLYLLNSLASDYPPWYPQSSLGIFLCQKAPFAALSPFDARSILEALHSSILYSTQRT